MKTRLKLRFIRKVKSPVRSSTFVDDSFWINLHQFMIISENQVQTISNIKINELITVWNTFFFLSFLTHSHTTCWRTLYFVSELV